MEKKSYIDLHTHTLFSDGKFNYYELVEEAENYGIQYLGITDHNYLMSIQEYEELQANFDNIIIIPGCEIDCEYIFQSGKKVGIHIVVLYPCLYNNIQEMRDLLENYRKGNREKYIKKLISNLKELGFNVGTYEELSKKYNYLGRAALANEMKFLGYVDTVNEANFNYLGNFGKRLALYDLPPKNMGEILSLDKVLDMAKKTYGISIVAHLNLYNLTESEEMELLEYVSKKAGISGGLEVNYRGYDEHLVNKLKNYSIKYNLFASCASDYHGYYETDSLDNQYEGTETYIDLFSRWLVSYVV